MLREGVRVTPYFNDGDLRLYCGDAAEVLRELPDRSVHMVCACGCGELVRNPDVRGRPRKYRRGHSLRVDASAQAEAARRTWTGRHHTDETKAKLSTAASVPKPWLRGERNGMAGRTGRTNPNWRGGVSPERQRLYASGEWKRVAQLVRKRDGNRCVRCDMGAPQLHVHHIKSFAEYPDLRLDLENLTSLCPDCHHAEHRKGVTL